MNEWVGEGSYFDWLPNPGLLALALLFLALAFGHGLHWGQDILLLHVLIFLSLLHRKIGTSTHIENTHI